MNITLDAQVRQSCRHLLSEINRDPATPAYGCFDRRYWAWKLADFPEATYQRNLANLAWYMQNCGEEADLDMIRKTVVAGLLYTARIQHRDGSFDQAYPFERSFGATGFLLPDLIKAYTAVQVHCTDEEITIIEDLLKRAAKFLCGNAEKHGLISNHLAGAALGLFMAAGLFQDTDYEDHAKQLLEYLLVNQSPEGWFPEYSGADPGYQTLCMHYLAQTYRLAPSAELKNALEKSLAFLQYFVHPDGSFGGEYGSRRTEIYYPGGIALLSGDFPLASVVHEYMKKSIENLTTVTLVDIDMGNMAPLLSSTILFLEAPRNNQANDHLPFEQEEGTRVFQDAGIAVYNNKCYYAILGASNGGVFKVFDKRTKKIVFDDCGALAETRAGRWISTQATRLDNPFSLEAGKFEGQSGFYQMGRRLTSPLNYLVLRILNITIMRIGLLNEAVKKLMVSWLIAPDKPVQLNRMRNIEFLETQIKVTDHYSLRGKMRLKNLFHTGKFNSIHMASSRYYAGSQKFQAYEVLDHQSLNNQGRLEVTRMINLEEREK